MGNQQVILVLKLKKTTPIRQAQLECECKQAISARRFKIRLRNYTIDKSLEIQTGKLSIQI